MHYVLYLTESFSMVMKKKGSGGKDFDHMATKSFWKYACGVLPTDIKKPLTVSGRARATNIIFWDLNSICTIELVDTIQERSKWQQQKW